MAKSGGPTVGLDIGSRMIKVAEVAPGRNGVVVRAIGIAPTPYGAMENSVIVDPKLLGEAVKKLLKESGVGTRRSVSSVSGQGALVVRVIEVPRMSDGELQETMRWEVERHVPFAANEVIMDFVPISRVDTAPDSQQMEVLLAVAQQDMIDRHVQMLFAAGLQPIAIDVEPLAAARALIDICPNPTAQKTIAIVNIGASNTDVGIFRDGVLAFPRTLPIGGDSLSGAIATHMGVDIDQGEEYKVRSGEVILDAAPVAAEPDASFFDFGTGGERPAVDLGGGAEAPGSTPVAVATHDETTVSVASAMGPVLLDLVNEIKRSIDYYSGRSSGGAVDEVLICGGSSGLRGLAPYLAAQLGIVTRIADPFANATLTAKNYSAEYLQQTSPSFVVAVGLAARDFVEGPAPAPAPRKSRGKK